MQIDESETYQKGIPVKVLRKIALPKGYHEGLFADGGNMWINNGEKGLTWVVSLDTGEVLAKIKPVGTFSEGITRTPDGKFWLTDWDSRKVYRLGIDEGKMVPDMEVSLVPSRPTGIVWNGEYLYVLTWTRGMGTSYHLIKMDQRGRIISKSRLKRIHEPSQLAWDGKYLWISSWYSKRVYKINVKTMEIVGHFSSPVSDTTGIVWDGGHMWLTGTNSDLYQLEIGTPEK